jgi:hypothetical protein
MKIKSYIQKLNDLNIDTWTVFIVLVKIMLHLYEMQAGDGYIHFFLPNCASLRDADSMFINVHA